MFFPSLTTLIQACKQSNDKKFRGEECMICGWKSWTHSAPCRLIYHGAPIDMQGISWFPPWKKYLIIMRCTRSPTNVHNYVGGGGYAPIQF